MTFMRKSFSNLCKTVIMALLLTASLTSYAIAESYGYQLALIDARASNPKKVLMNQKISPDSAAVREFEWILETLRNRSTASQDTVVKTLVETWRLVQRRGYNVTLLEFSRETSDFSNIAFKMMRNQKMDFDKIILKLLKDKFPAKH